MRQRILTLLPYQQGMTSTVLLVLAVINLWTIVVFWQDKARAISGRRRIRESDLLMCALIGGTPGAFLARHVFRHKTRKEPFSTYLQIIVMVQAGLLSGYWLS